MKPNEPGTAKHVKDLIIKAIDTIERRFKNHGSISGVPTGFHLLDARTNGLQTGNLIVIAGRPSMGKTALALNIATNAALATNRCVALFSPEMSADQLMMRLMANESRVSGTRIANGYLSTNHDMPALVHAADRLAGTQLVIDDTPSLSVSELCKRAWHLRSENDLALIVVDCLQLLVDGPDGEVSGDNSTSNITHSLRTLARELDVPVVATSQLTARVEERAGDKRPVLGDLPDPEAIERDADLIAFIYRKKVYAKTNAPAEAGDDVAEIIVAKNRNGLNFTVKLAFMAEYVRFENLGYGEDWDQPEQN